MTSQASSVSELVERLLNDEVRQTHETGQDPLCVEAADTLQSLTAERDAVIEQLEHSQEAWKSTCDKNLTLKAERDALREALRFYVEDAWEQAVDAEQTANGWEGSIGELEPTEALYRDRGERARAALKDTSGEVIP